MINYADEILEIPYITEKEGIVVKVNPAFLTFSGFSEEEILNESLLIVWHKLLRIYIEPDKLHSETIMFTKQLEARSVMIHVQKDLMTNEAVYSFNELPSSRFEDKNQFVMKLISENATGVGIYTAPDFILINANQTYLNQLPKPYNTKEIVFGKPIKYFIPNFEGSHGEKVWREIVASNKSIYVKEKQGLMLDEGGKYWDNTITPISENGQVRYIISILDDVTERVLSREHIARQAEIVKQQKEELDAIIDNISEGLAIINKHGEYVKVNKKAREYARLSTNIGRTVAKVGASLSLGEKYYDMDGNILTIDDFPSMRVIKGHKVEKQVLVARAGNRSTFFEYNGNPVVDENGNLRFGVLLSRDITGQVLAERLIKAQKDQLESILDNVPDAVYIIGRNNKFLFINAEARRKIFNEESINCFIDYYNSTNFYDENDIRIPLHLMPTIRALKGEIISNFHMKIARRNRQWIADINAAPIYDDNGEISMVIVCLRDITLQLKLQHEKDEALEASMRLKDEFLYLITHEFKTPITVINSALQTINLVCKEEKTARLDMFLNTIKQNTNRQLRLVNNLLDITRINSGHLKLNMCNIDIVYITNAIVQSVGLYAQQKKIQLQFTSDITEEIISIDEEKYERILLNLLSNALKFTPNEKSIHVSLSTKKYNNKNYISISVKDEGIGIPQDMQDHIFERFGQVDGSLSRQAEGTGLGLYLTKLLIDSLKGAITLESDESKGSTFTILLPKYRDAALDQIAASAETVKPFMSRNNRIIEATAIEFSDIYF